MDALFGLPRKRSAGKSLRDPLHGKIFFGDQNEVDQFVAAHESQKKKVPKVTSMCDYVIDMYALFRKNPFTIKMPINYYNRMHNRSVL